MKAVRHWTLWAVWGACWLAAALAWGAMGGVGREGDYVLEIFAQAKEIGRTGRDKWVVSVPKDLGPLMTAAGVKAGTSVKISEQRALATLVKTETKWRSLELTIRVSPLESAPHGVQQFQIMPWEEFSRQIRTELADVSKNGDDTYGPRLGKVLSRVQTMFGGAAMVEGFPKTAYAREFAKIKRWVDLVVRAGIARGRPVSSSVKSQYKQLFGEEWPQVAMGIFWSATGEPVEVREVRSAGRNISTDVFPRGVPVKVDGQKHVAGIFPCDGLLQFRFGREGEAPNAGRVVGWRFDAEGIPAWFMLYPGAEGRTKDVVTRVENRSSVGVRASVVLGSREITARLPAQQAVDLCLVMPPDVTPEFRAEADPRQTPDAADYTVSLRMSDGIVLIESALKEHPEVVLNNPEIIPVEVEILAEQGKGRFTSVCKVRLKAGEVGYGVPVPPHKALKVKCAFKSAFLRDVTLPVEAMGYGGRQNLVLRADKKNDPSVVVMNAGPVSVKISGVTGPKDTVMILPRKSETVTVAAGKKSTLEVTPLSADYEGTSVEVNAMKPGEKSRVTVKAVAKAAPRVILDNTQGMMDVEATLVTSAGVAVAPSVKVRRGKSSAPITLPPRQGLGFRLQYSYDDFTATGKLDVPVIPRGETKMLVVPNPRSVGSAAAPAKKSLVW